MQPSSRLQVVVDRALARSAASLSEMSGVDISIGSSAVERVPLHEVPLSVGEPEEPAVGVYVGIEGDGAGYVLLLLEEGMAMGLAELLLGESTGKVDLRDELAASALAEAGNVSCSAFINEVGEATRLRLMAMPPVVVDDMRAAILDVVVAEIVASGDEALVIKSHLGRADEPQGRDRVNARLLAIPTPETLDAILDRLAA
ncbi:MAG: chemotaxis protein CheX [Chloroflexota bacterium]|nr:chemotaxis protein CheX [Chloroflexota bacterium]